MSDRCDVQIARHRREDLRPDLAQDDDFFEANAEAAGYVDAGLDGKDHALLEHRLRCCGDIRRLMCQSALNGGSVADLVQLSY